MQNRGLSASTIKTELAAIRFFHDNMPYTRYELPTNEMLDLERRTFGGVDRTWEPKEYDMMLEVAKKNDHEDYITIFSLARFAGFRLDECFRIDTNDAQNAIESGNLYVKGKGGQSRYVPINEIIKAAFAGILKKTPRGQKLFVAPDDKTDLAMKRLQCFIAYHRKEFTENQITFHGLRHTCASLLLKNGVSMKQIQEWLGHSDFSTTANKYSHLDYDSKIISANAMLEAVNINV